MTTSIRFGASLHSIALVIAVGLAAGLGRVAPAAATICDGNVSLALVQSTTGNFEMAMPSPNGGLVHYWRNNSTDAVPWSSPIPFGTGNVSGVAMIQSNLTTNGVGHLEAVATVGNELHAYWRDDGGTWQWSGPTVIGTGVRGVPAIVQGKWGTNGNFEVVVPWAGGGLAHYWRNNDGPPWQWYGPTLFGHAPYIYESVAMVQSNLGRGQLEVVARIRNYLHHYQRDDGGTWHWSQITAEVGNNAQGTPSFIQSRNGVQGNFELLTPMQGGGLAHYWRDNDDPARPWRGPQYVPRVNGNVSAVSVIRSRYGAVGNLEYVAHVDGELQGGWRDDGNTWSWNGPYPFSAQACSAPQEKGLWANALDTDIVGTHSVLLRTGNILFHSMTDNSELAGMSRVLNPLSGALTTPGYNGGEHPVSFCSAQSQLPDGRIYVVGGHNGDVSQTNIYDPATNRWSNAGGLAEGRWYATTATLPTGQVFMISGTKSHGRDGSNIGSFNDTWQTFDTASNNLSTPMPVAPYPFSSDNFGPIDLYPFVYLLPDSRLFIHSRNSTRLFNPWTNVWDTARYDMVRPFSRSYPGTGASVLLPLMPNSSPPYRVQVAVMGGGGTNDLVPETPATSTAEIIDLGADPPRWTPLPSMSYARVMPDATLLPDGTVFVVGGSATGRADAASTPVLTPELFNPADRSWTRLSPMRVPRLYHSSALLLPDARVLVAGKDSLFNPVPYHYPEHRVEIFSPPYLFRGARPVIGAAPDVIGYNASFNVDVSQIAPTGIQRVALIRLGTATHSLNMDQRYVGLNFTPISTGLVLQAPPNASIAPPGYYMLFLVGPNGVPSVARILRLQ